MSKPTTEPMLTWIDDRHYSDSAKTLHTRLGLPLLSEASAEHSYDPEKDALLSWQTPKKSVTQQLTLIPPNTGAISIDFLGGKKAHRRQFGGGKGQPLIRAMGSLEERLPEVFDATAGMGGDSFVLASLGFNVWMNERSPIVHALLQDALQRAQNADDLEPETRGIIERLKLTNGDSAEIIRHCEQELETIYLDPMYPEKRKKAATKKEMAALQQLLGPDMDSSDLLDAALNKAIYRVVVKRPKGAEPIAHEIQPTTAVQSPNTRYDIYVIKTLKR
ncbi:class I SAM-dependent methyltransferase [Thiomicrorhabdus sp. 6S3-12]|uniref:class I SAM-dependent methyltransferase n=1 Tax=Thiomicrorhabdus sp. 6S3-12 TaxID=2819681 RepID=UPI001FB571B9|nr:class I SAM-dependent methyltransferase [Thiomicrorhabdus sp. 6S3-12]